MKINLHKVNGDGAPNETGIYWAWKETCDKCGKVVFEKNMSNQKPDDNEEDYCIKCARILIEEIIRERTIWR